MTRKAEAIILTVRARACAGRGVNLDWVETSNLARLFETLTDDQRRIVSGKAGAKPDRG